MSRPVSMEENIAKIFAEQLNLAVPSVDTDLFATGALDSLSFVKLLVHLEREYEVKVSLEELELDNFRSLKKIAEYIADFKIHAGERAALDRAPYPRTVKRR